VIAASLFQRYESRDEGDFAAACSRHARQFVVTPKSPPEVTIHSIVGHGVSGSGKTTVGRISPNFSARNSSTRTWLHSHDNLSRWRDVPSATNSANRGLHAVGENLARSQRGCSRPGDRLLGARRRYRDVLRTYVPRRLFRVLDATPELLRERVTTRQHEFMPLHCSSRVATLEPSERRRAGVPRELREDTRADRARRDRRAS